MEMGGPAEAGAAGQRGSEAPSVGTDNLCFCLGSGSEAAPFPEPSCRDWPEAASPCAQGLSSHRRPRSRLPASALASAAARANFAAPPLAHVLL